MYRKGQSGNPKGRPKGCKNTFTLESLQKALRRAEKAHKVGVLEHFIHRAYKSDKVLIALIKKLIPDANHDLYESESEKELLNHEIQIIKAEDIPMLKKELKRRLSR